MRTSTFRLIPAALAAVLLAATTACDSATGPVPELTIAATSDSVRVTRIEGDFSAVTVRITLSIYNNGSVPVYLMPCAEQLEREAVSGWVAVWSPVCLAAPVPPIEIGPGDEYRYPFEVYAAQNANSQTDWIDASVAGRYRVLLGIAAQREGDGQLRLLPVHERASHPFVLRE